MSYFIFISLIMIGITVEMTIPLSGIGGDSKLTVGVVTNSEIEDVYICYCTDKRDSTTELEFMN